MPRFKRYFLISARKKNHIQLKLRYSTFSEAGSSISAVAPLISNLLTSSRKSIGQQQNTFAPDYLQRTSDSLEKMKHHHEFQSGLLQHYIVLLSCIQKQIQSKYQCLRRRFANNSNVSIVTKHTKMSRGCFDAHVPSSQQNTKQNKIQFTEIMPI